MTAAARPANTEMLPVGERRGLRWVGVGLGVAATAVALVLAVFDWNWLRSPLSLYASDATGRRVRMDGDLKVHLLTGAPTVSIDGLHIGQPTWAGTGDMADIDRIVVQTTWRSLIHGKPVLPLLELDRPRVDLRRTATGKTNWSFGPRFGSNGARLPAIEHFVIDQGRVHYADAGRKLLMDGQVESNERADGPTAHAFNLTGRGTLNAKPFEVRVVGGPLINVKTDQPYPVTATVVAGDTHVEATGALRRPFDLSGYAMDLHVTGRDLADLYDLTGLALPNTPPYDLHGALSHSAQRYAMERLSGRIGSSDATGHFTVERRQGRPFVDAVVRSRSLDFKDLATLFGGAPSAKSLAKAKPAVKAVAAALRAQQRLLPDAPLYTRRLRTMDARLDFRAEAVKDTPLPIRSGAAKVKLDHGLLTVDPLSLDLPQGRLTATIALNGRGAIPVTDVDARLTGADIKNLFPGAGAAPIEGLVAARAKLHGVGDSVHQAASRSDGAVTVVIPHGHMRKAFAELLGVNAGRGLLELLSKNQDQSNIRCGVAAFSVRNGHLSVRQLMLDTDVVRVNGQGGGDFGSETLNLSLKGDTKKLRFTHLFLPITVTGHFRDPKIGVEPGPAIAQVGVAAAIGAVLGPLAAVLPFVDPGLAKNADCQSLMADAQTRPAPVRGALPTTPTKK